MGVPTITGLPPNPDFSQVAMKVNSLVTELRNILLTLDSNNALEFGGWEIQHDKFISIDGDVGMSTEDTGGDDVRFFAGPNGDVWFYYVTKSGKLYATDAFITGLITGSTIIGGVIKTAETGARIELEDGVLKGYSEDNNLHGLVFSPTPVSNFFDLFMYHDGAKILEFIDNAVSITMRGASDSIGMILGGTSSPTFGAGSWSFTGNASFINIINGSITGHAASADYADNAGIAAAADSLAPSGNIAWGQVLKSGSNLEDLATKNLSSLTEDSTHRSVTDTEKSTWNAKQSTSEKNAASGYAGLDSSAKLSRSQLPTNSAFMATQTTSVSIVSNVFTKITFTSEVYDNLGEYDAPNSKFTATIAGKYVVTSSVFLNGSAAGDRLRLAVFKNGSFIDYLFDFSAPTTAGCHIRGSSPALSLSVGDYIEIYALMPTAITTVADATTNFSIYKVA